MNTPKNTNEKPVVTEFTFPQFMPERSYQYDCLLNEMPLFWATPQFHFASNSNGVGYEDHCLLGAELAAHYVQFARDSQEEGVCECLYRHLLPIVLEAPEGVKAGFLRTIERLLVGHVDAPFVAVESYERESYDILEESRKEEARRIDAVSSLETSGESKAAVCSPDDVYDVLHRIETTAKMLAFSVSTEKLDIADGLTAVVLLDELVGSATALCDQLELSTTKAACEAFHSLVVDSFHVFSESLEFRLPTSVEQATTDKLADLATAAVQALDKHTGLDQVKTAA